MTKFSEMTHILELADCKMFPEKKLKLKGVKESLPTAKKFKNNVKFNLALKIGNIGALCFQNFLSNLAQSFNIAPPYNVIHEIHKNVV